MEFNLESFLIGLIVGAAILAILRVHALKSLAIKLNQIGVELGIEGFEPEKQGASLKIGDVSGTVGDVALGNIDKSVSNFHRNLKKVLGTSEAAPLYMQRTEHVRVSDETPSFVKQLEAIQQRRSDGWFEEWLAACLSNQSIAAQLKRKLESITQDGWRPVSMNFDNVPGGVHVNIDVRKPFPR